VNQRFVSTIALPMKQSLNALSTILNSTDTHTYRTEVGLEMCTWEQKSLRRRNEGNNMHGFTHIC
jgi:hypothetical protein